MTKLFPDFMDKASLAHITQGDVGALRASVAALDALIDDVIVVGTEIEGGETVVGYAIDTGAPAGRAGEAFNFDGSTGTVVSGTICENIWAPAAANSAGAGSTIFGPGAATAVSTPRNVHVGPVPLLPVGTVITLHHAVTGTVSGSATSVEQPS